MLQIDIAYHYQTVLNIKGKQIFSFINPKKTPFFYEVASLIVFAGNVKSMMQTGLHEYNSNISWTCCTRENSLRPHHISSRHMKFMSIILSDRMAARFRISI